MKTIDKIEDAISEFSKLYDKLVKTVNIKDGKYDEAYTKLSNYASNIFDADILNYTVRFKSDKKLDEGYYKQTWTISGAYAEETFTLYVNLKSHYVCLNTNKIEPAEEPKEEQSKVPEFAQLCITNYERLQKLSILEVAEELISTIRIKDENGLTRKKYMVLNGDVCNSLSDAIKKNLEWLNDESV